MQLPEKKEHDKLGAAHVNELSRAARIVLTPKPSSYQAGVGSQTSGIQNFDLRSCEIIEEGYEDDYSDHVYTIKVRYYDSNVRLWFTDERGGTYCLDDKQNQTGFEIGDFVQAYYDPQRVAYIPLVSPGGSGSPSVWATVEEVFCDSEGDSLLTYVKASVTWFTGGCSAAIPDEDPYGLISVYQICDIFTSYYTAENLVGKTIRATYMNPRSGYCVPKWLVDEVCGQPECA